MLKTCRFHKKGALLALTLAVALIAGCGGVPGITAPSALPTATAAAPTPTPKPALAVQGIDVFSDPEVLTESTEDPCKLLTLGMLKPEDVDHDKYNAVFHAVENLEPTMDISSFHYSRIMMNNLVSSIDTNFLLFYLKGYHVSKDGRTVKFTYTGDRTQIQHDTETFHAKLGHLINDVAPDGYTDLQKLAALYDAVCRMSNYTADIQDLSTWSPYSIVMNGQGICSGYAMLMRYLLNQSAVQAELVSNEPHAWNIVKINGAWYNSDTTWGAGNAGDTINNLKTLLMDDAARAQSMEDNGYTSKGVILGGHSSHEVPPPACTDARFNAYGQTGWCYALDLENQQVYFDGDEGITRMNLDCTNRQTFLKGTYSFQMEIFDGFLYYIDSNDSFLYKAGSDGNPELLCNSAMLTRLNLENAKLSYSYYKGTELMTETIDLLPGAAKLLSAKDMQTLPEASVPRSSSFGFKVKFSQPMDAKADWNQLVYLVDAKGEAIPLSFRLDGSGTELTVRPKSCLADAETVTLLLDGSLTTADGAKLAAPCRKVVRVVSGQ